MTSHAQKIQTAEYVNDEVLDLFRLANISADTASLDVAKGRMMKATNKEGMFEAVEKLSTASTRGSEHTAATMVPISSIDTALEALHLGFSISSATSSFLSPSRSYSVLARCISTIQ